MVGSRKPRRRARWNPKRVCRQRNFAKPHVATGTLVEIRFENLSNGIDLWVDVVWSRERPLGLDAQCFVALMARDKQ